MAIDESSFRVKPGVRVRISDYDPADTRLMPDKKKAENEIKKDIARLDELQERLYAEHQRSLVRAGREHHPLRAEMPQPPLAPRVALDRAEESRVLVGSEEKPEIGSVGRALH